MAKPKHITLTEDGVITQEALLAYAEGRLSVDETAQLEKLLKDDPFAQDALEGMRSTAAPGEMKSVITSLNVQLREKTGAREKKKKGVEIHWATYAYAAMIVGILIGLGFVMIHFIADKDQRIAMSKQAPQAEESVPTHEDKTPASIPADSTSSKTDTTGMTTKGAAGSQTYQWTDSMSVHTSTNGAVSNNPNSGGYTISVTDADKAAKADDRSKSNFAAAPIAAMKEQSQKNASMSLEKTPDAANTKKPGQEQKTKGRTDDKNQAHDMQILDYGNAPSPTEKDKVTQDGFIIDKPMPNNEANFKREKKAEAVSVTPTDKLKAARGLFDAGDYKAAAKVYNQVLSDQPDNADALYFGGISDYFNGKGKQAEKNFDKLLKTGVYVEGSKWYKANVLIDKGKKDEAKQLLRDLINTNSSFKDRAVKKYEEIVK